MFAKAEGPKAHCTDSQYLSYCSKEKGRAYGMQTHAVGCLQICGDTQTEGENLCIDQYELFSGHYTALLTPAIVIRASSSPTCFATKVLV